MDFPRNDLGQWLKKLVFSCSLRKTFPNKLQTIFTYFGESISY
jgi:hypothetical protein